MLNEAQVAALLKPINPRRVLTSGGQAHVPAYDVAAHLTRILGFGNWDTHLLDVTQLFESSEERVGKNKDGTERRYLAWTIGYAATIKLTIKDQKGNEVASWENGACGEAVNQPSRGDAHHLAMTTAISTALKRCAAFGLGDQFGLSLYNKGSKEALVRKTLVGAPVTMDGEPVKGTALMDLEADIPEPESMGNDERQFDITPGIPLNETDWVNELRVGLKASGMTNTEAKEFVEESIKGPLGKFSDLTQDQARLAYLQLEQYVLGGDPTEPVA